MEKTHDQKLQNVINELERLSEDFTQSPKPGSRPGSLKRKASQYLGKGAGEKLSKTDLERDRGTQLARQVSFAYNMGK